ncbi:hypothetical protein EWM64_g9232 [Hericium alpestre]|uniref:Uncharacterized protein n=1 Tax=Hericium alpestre TaxID=135208 RepID=A0A4Y9ZKP9_9AGAM|nr:hypothetical protein EWM64_g9232 [Hericium alpestre]
MVKASYDMKEKYRTSIRAHGVVGSTVRTVDNAPSTKLIFNGKTPALAHPAMQQNRLKRELIRKEKLHDNPAGLGMLGVHFEYIKDQGRPQDQRYIHYLVSKPDGGVLILTFNPFLASLIHRAETIHVDTTFKRAVGDLNEWEIVIWYAAINKTVTIGRVYTNRADRAHYKALFDKVQEVILDLTGRPLRFKRLSRGGTLLSMNVDMEAAQVLGAGDSFLSTNEPDYSGITTREPEELVQYFVKLCYAHVKRAIHDFKSLVTQADYRRLMDFPYIQSEEELQAFQQFVRDLGIKKIQDWWEHKLQHRWILPAIMKLRTRINHDDWDATPSTTNAGESQHHWTNQHTGTSLSLLEAILSARTLDEKVAAEIQASLKAGTLTNSQNEFYHRLVRSVKRQTTSAQKSRHAAKQNDKLAQLREQIEDEKEARKVSLQRQKTLQEQLGSSQGKPRSKRTSRTVQRTATKANNETTFNAYEDNQVLDAHNNFDPRALDNGTHDFDFALDFPDIPPFQVPGAAEPQLGHHDFTGNTLSDDLRDFAIMDSFLDHTGGRDFF